MTARTRPDFIGIGAQKAATSWIHFCLYDHPQIYLPPTKELHFFSRHYQRGADWYREQFSTCTDDQLAGEISPSYLYDQATPERIHQWNPDVKLLVSLRNPVDRSISAFRYERKMGVAPEGERLSDAFQQRRKYLLHSHYHAALSRYLELFSPDRLLVCIYEDIALDPRAFVRRVLEFLEVDPDFIPSGLEKKVNPSLPPPRWPWLDRLTRNTANGFRRLGMDQMVWKIARSPLGEGLVRFNRKRETAFSLTSAERRELVARFRDDVEATSKLVGRDLGRLWFGDRPAGEEEAPLSRASS